MNKYLYVSMIVILISAILDFLVSSKRLSKIVSGIIRLCCITVIYFYLRIFDDCDPEIYVDVLFGLIAIGLIIEIIYHVRKKRNFDSKDV